MSIRLLTAMAFGLPATGLTQSPSPPTPADSANYQVVKLAEGIYAFVAPDGITPMVSGNSTVIIGDDAVLVVDPGQFPSVARWEIGRIKAFTTKPVRYIVNTHWHPDHWVGNETFRAAYPEAAISTPATSAAMRDDARPFLDPNTAARTRDAIDRMLSTGKGAGGAPLDAEIRFLGRGNTAGDAVVYVPDAKVLVTGDLLVHPYPYAFGSFISEWITTLGQLGALGATTIVPGHGAVEHDRTYLDQVVEMLGLVQSEARASAGRGQSLEDATRTIDLARFERSMCAADPFCRYGFRASVNAMIGRAYKEAKEGKLVDEK